MAWTPTLPAEPRGDRWWNDVWIYQQEAAVADARRAERIEQLHRRCHELDMKLAGALQGAEWNRIQRRRDLQGAIRYKGMLINSGGAREIEHSGPWGQVLDVQ